MGLAGAELRDKGQVFGIAIRTAVVDPPLIGIAASGDVVVTVPGVVAGDLVIGIPPVTMTGALAPVTCIAGAGTVTVRIANASAAAIDGAALTWTFIIFDRTELLG